jgi:phospholipid-translocating ATPase
MVQDKETGRLRWASQRHPKGRPRKSTALSVFRRLSRASDTTRPNSTALDSDVHSQHLGDSLPPNGNEERLPAPPPPDPVREEEEVKTERRRIYVNMRLPPEETHDDGTPLHYYPRNKIRTAKYTPLTFIPKNLYFQFHNVANIYFLFIVILQVTFIVRDADPDISNLWRFESWSWSRPDYSYSHHHRHKGCHGGLATYRPRQRTQ